MSSAKTHTVELRGNLGIRDAAGLATSLASAIAAHPSVTISAAQLTEVDVSILQVLASAHRTAVQSGKSLLLKAPEEGALKQTLRKAGFTGAGAPLTPEREFFAASGARTKGKAA